MNHSTSQELQSSMASYTGQKVTIHCRIISKYTLKWLVLWSVRFADNSFTTVYCKSLSLRDFRHLTGWEILVLGDSLWIPWPQVKIWTKLTSLALNCQVSCNCSLEFSFVRRNNCSKYLRSYLFIVLTIS